MTTSEGIATGLLTLFSTMGGRGMVASDLGNRPLKSVRIAMVNDVAGVAAHEVTLLRAAGYDVDFFKLPLIGASWPTLAKIVALPIRLLSYFPTFYKLYRRNYNVLHIHFVSQGIVGLVVGKPFFIHAHGSDLHVNLKDPIKRAISLLVLRRAVGIFYVTPNLRQFLSDFADKSQLLPNPVDSRRFLTTPPPSRISRVLIFMRLDPIKGIDLILERAGELAGLVDLTALDWGSLARDYRRRYGSFLRFVQTVPRTEIPALLGQFDAVIGQMQQGVLGLSELEGLASGRIVFSNLAPNLYGEDPPPVVDVKTSAQLVIELRKLMGDRSKLQELSAAGRAWVERNHGPQGHLKGLVSAYQLLLSAD